MHGDIIKSFVRDLCDHKLFVGLDGGNGLELLHVLNNQRREPKIIFPNRINVEPAIGRDLIH